MPDIGCSPNAAKAFDYFLASGLRDFQAAAIVGNLYQESHINPTNDAPDPTPSNPNARGRGIAAWGPTRWDRLLSFAAATGRDPWTIDVQLDFLRYELESFPDLGFSALTRATSLEEATRIFQDRFERPKAEKAALDKRIGYARNTLDWCAPVVIPRRVVWGSVASGIAALALATVAGFGVYKALQREPEEEPML